MATRKPTFISLFSGCGGLDLGFINAGYCPLGAFDADELAVTNYKKNVHKSAYCEDISQSFSIGTLAREVDVVIAGPPCQGFSTAGKRDPSDPRNLLLSRAASIAVSLSPSVILLENVTGVTAGIQKKHWDNARKIIKHAGYKATDIDCDAVSLGIAQTRRRRLMVAWNNEFQGEFKLPERPISVLKDILRGVTNHTNHEPILLSPNSHAAKIAHQIKPNQKLCNVRSGDRSVHTWDIPDVFGYTTKAEKKLLEILLKLRRQHRLRNYGDADPVSGHRLRLHGGIATKLVVASLIHKGFVRRIGRRYDLVHTFNGKYRRLSWNEPSPTVHTRFGDPRYFLHPSEHRGMSVREAARIQGFPDTYSFEGRIHDQFRLVGNAVPPPLGEAVAVFIKKHLL